MGDYTQRFAAPESQGRRFDSCQRPIVAFFATAGLVLSNKCIPLKFTLTISIKVQNPSTTRVMTT